MDIAEIIRQRISKLRKLEELASDPEMADMMKEIGRAVAMDGQSITPPTVNHVAPGDEPGPTLGPKAAVQSALPAFINRKFTHNDVIKELSSRGYHFNAKNVPVTVSGILKRLAEEGPMKKVEGKTGPNGATLYEFPPNDL